MRGAWPCCIVVPSGGVEFQAIIVMSDHMPANMVAIVRLAAQQSNMVDIKAPAYVKQHA